MYERAKANGERFGCQYALGFSVIRVLNCKALPPSARLAIVMKAGVESTGQEHSFPRYFLLVKAYLATYNRALFDKLSHTGVIALQLQG